MFEDLETPLDQVETKSAPKNEKKFACDKCAGTGKYTFGYVHRRTGKCFACAGKGYFKTSREDRRKGRESRELKRNRKYKANVEAYTEQHPEIMSWIKRNAGQNDFADSLLSAVQEWGPLTDKQRAAVQKIVDRDAERKAGERERSKTVEHLDFSGIVELFDTTDGKLKYPKLKWETSANGRGMLKLQRAGNRSRYVGCINITDGGAFGSNEWYGRIDTDGKFVPSAKATPEIIAELTSLNESPREFLSVTGLRTGRCCCCHRELTDPVSIENGIGPICAEKWGVA